MKFLSIVRTIVSLLPMLIQVIRSVEEAIPGQGKGEQKLVMVRSVLEAAFDASNDIESSFDELWPALQRAIAAIVTALNSSGEFKA